MVVVTTATQPPFQRCRWVGPEGFASKTSRSCLPKKNLTGRPGCTTPTIQIQFAMNMGGEGVPWGAQACL